MYSLVGCFVKQTEETEFINDVLFYCLVVKLNSKFKRTLYFKSILDRELWLSQITKACGMRKLRDVCKILNKEGSGHFGTVFAGTFKN